jgi:hypothetical protein
MELLCHGRTTDDGAPFENGDLQSGGGKITGADQSVVATAD